MTDSPISGDELEGESENVKGSPLIDRLVERAVRNLTDATRNNPLLYYRQSRTTRFTLPTLDSPFVAKLLEYGEITAARLLRFASFGTRNLLAATTAASLATFGGAVKAAILSEALPHIVDGMSLFLYGIVSS